MSFSDLIENGTDYLFIPFAFAAVNEQLRSNFFLSLFLLKRRANFIKLFLPQSKLDSLVPYK
jgi:hypothetical protein